jgi:hypothetical protein
MASEIFPPHPAQLATLVSNQQMLFGAFSPRRQVKKTHVTRYLKFQNGI